MRVDPKPGRTLENFTAKSASAARLLSIGSANVTRTSRSAAPSLAMVVLPATAAAQRISERIDSRSDWMSFSAMRQMSSREAWMASALDGLSCTMPSEMSGVPVAPESCAPSMLSCVRYTSGLLAVSRCSVGVPPSSLVVESMSESR